MQLILQTEYRKLTLVKSLKNIKVMIQNVVNKDLVFNNFQIYQIKVQIIYNFMEGDSINPLKYYFNNVK